MSDQKVSVTGRLGAPAIEYTGKGTPPSLLSGKRQTRPLAPPCRCSARLPQSAAKGKRPIVERVGSATHTEPQMHSVPSLRCGNRSGIALIVVLGLLLVLTAMAIGFSILMRGGTISARRYADRTRARYYLHAALPHCMSQIGTQAVGRDSVYPYWENSPPAASGRAFASWSEFQETNAPILVELATNWLPQSVWADATNVMPQWLYVVGVGEDNGIAHSTNGRIAYLAVNCSGLIDINHVVEENGSGTNRLYELAALRDDFFQPSDVQVCLDDLETHRHYETLPELGTLNRGLFSAPANDLFIYSYDPNPYQYFTNQTDLGSRSITLTNRFNVNGLTNYAAPYQSAAFSNDWFRPFSSLLSSLGRTNSDSLVWSAVNLMDEDHIPQSSARLPYLEDYGGEAVPLINELVVQKVDSAISYEYEVGVEGWFPFAPATTEAGQYRLQVGVFREPNDGVPETEIMDQADPAWSFTTDLPAMAFGGPNEFVAPLSPESARISFQVEVPALGGGTATINLPLGVCSYTNYIGGQPQIVEVTNEVFLLARVLDGSGRIMDEAMGYDSRAAPGDARSLLRVDAPVVYEINDPRMNGHSNRWEQVAQHSLGSTNSIYAQGPGGQGLPIVHLDRPLEAPWELGQVHDPEAGPWHNLNLLSGTHSVAPLLDRVAVSNVAAIAEPWSYGRININTRSTNVLQALFQSIPLTLPTAADGTTNEWHIEEAPINALADVLITNEIYYSVGSMFPDTAAGTALADAVRACVPTNDAPRLDYLEEQVIGKAAEKLTFRQNIFVIFMVAQALNDRGTRVQAETRAMAIIYRDAWTGSWFIKDWREL